MGFNPESQSKCRCHRLLQRGKFEILVETLDRPHQRVAEGIGGLAVAGGPILEGGDGDVLAQHVLDGLLVLPLQRVGQGGDPGQGAGLDSRIYSSG